jgi:uncharacterized phage protein (TIGR01671 family)
MKTVNRTKLTSDWLQSQKEKDIKQERIMSRHALDGKFGSAIKKLKIMDSKNQIQSREIKFRAWLKTNKIMTEIDKIDFINNEVAFGFYEGSIDAVELMQYTGLKDKNGKEIYEGDIVKMYFDKDEISNWLYASFSNETLKNGFFFETVEIPECYSKPFPDEFEVIGNIYEHKHLLD